MNKHRNTINSSVLAVIFATWLLSITACGMSSPGELVCRRNSLYTGIFVYKQDSVSTLRFGMRYNAPIQSQVDVKDLRRHMLEYTELSFCGLLFNPDPNNVLVLGQGGGVIPREMHHYYPQARIDVVEIDSEIPKIAEQYFAFESDDKLQVHVEDGRMFIKKKLLKEPGCKYDYIVLDAFNGDYIPFHLMTKEFLEEVESILTDDGVIVANVFSSNRLFDAELKTFFAVFDNCQVFMCRSSGNAMIVAMGSKCKTLTIDEAAKRAAELEQAKSFSFDISTFAQQLRQAVPSKDAYVLTDDKAPVNWLKEKTTK